MANLSVRLRCPKCDLPGEATLEEASYKCIMFICPRCRSNVVFYDNKIDIITDKCLSKLVKHKKLQFCGNVNFKDQEEPKKRRTRVRKKSEPPKNIVPRNGAISRDDVLNLKILLETEQDFDAILSQL